MSARKGSAVVSIRVDDPTVLDEQAKASGVTRSEFVRQLIAGLGEGGGVWVAYYPHEPGAHVYPSELEARRGAEGTSMSVKFVKYGEGI